jgi:hypothetical protein
MATDRTEGSQDWSLPESAKPPLIGELVERIDEALAVARSAEAAAVTIGAAALDAAEQAKRAAELAGRASAPTSAAPATPTGGRPVGGPLVDQASLVPARDAMEDFRTRADRVAARLERLQRLPLSA